MYGLDLFTGIGGITLALQDYVTPMAYCEIDPYCQSVLLQRMQEGNLPKAPIWDDIRTLQAQSLPQIDIMYGGFPCQDISVAGRQKGLEGERSGLFFEILRIIDATKASFVFLENVPNIRTKGAERVCKELAERGYDCRWCNISAADVGARHKRERWFLLAHTNNSEYREQEPKGIGEEDVKEAGNWKKKCSLRITRRTGEVRLSDKDHVADTEREGSGRNGMDEGFANKSEGLQSKDRETHPDNVEQSGEDASHSKSERLHERHQYQEGQTSRYGGIKQSNWSVEPDVGRVVNGLPHRVDRIKALGNSVVPLQVKTAFELLMGM